jgi:dihydropteroate synthase
MINDITGGRDAALVATVAASDAAYALMHMQGSPQTMQNNPSYVDVVGEVAGFLAERISTCVANGVIADQIAIDPGFGFGKSLEHNLHLLRCLEQVRVRQHPLLVGLSRKSMLGTITGKPVEERDTASVVAAVLAAQNGADIIRVHDVAKTTDGLQVLKHVAAPS